MPGSNLITQAEIARLLGIKTTKLEQLKRTQAFTLPEPVAKHGHYWVYDRSMVLQCLLHFQNKKTPAVLETTPPPTFLAALSGQFDRPELQRQYAYKRLATKLRQPKTITEHLYETH